MRSPFIAYPAALAIAVLTVAVRFLLGAALGDQLPFIISFLAIALAAWLYGTGPAVVAMFAGAVGIAFFVMRPQFTFAEMQFAQMLGLVLYCGISIAIIAIFNSLSNAQLQTLAERNQLQKEVVARKAAEKEVADRDMLIRTAFASIGEAIITTDANCMIKDLNAVAQQLTGWSYERAVGQPLATVYNIVNEATGAGVESIAYRVLREEKVVRLPWRCSLIQAGGSTKPIDDSAAPLRNEAGQIIGAVLIFRDVSERRQAEAVQAASATRFRMAAEAVNGIIYERDLVARTVECTRGLYEVVGYHSDEVPSTEEWWVEQVHPEDRIGKFAEFNQSQKNESTLVCEYRVKHKGGRWLDVEDRAVLVRDATGHPSKVIGCMVNISERKQAERALRDSESILRSFYESAPMMMGVVELPEDDTDIIHLYDNPETDRFFGNPIGSTAGKSAFANGAPDDVISMWVKHYRLSQHTQTPVRFEYEQMTTRGSIWLACVATYIGDVSTGRSRFSYVAEDVTYRKTAEVALQTERARLALGIQVAGLALAEIDYVNGVTNLSSEAAKMLGLGQTAMQVAREQVHAAFHPDDRPELVRKINEIIQPGGPGWFSVDLRVLLPTGEIRWLRVRKQVFYSGEGEQRRAVRGTLASLDVTTEKNAAEAISASEQFVRGVLNSLPEHVVVLDSSGSVRAVNETWERNASLSGGIRLAVSEGVDYLQVCRSAAQQGDSYAQAALAGLQCVLDGEKDAFVLEYPCHAPDGEQWFLMYAKRAQYGPPGVILSHIDITERVKAAHYLRESQDRLFLALEAAFMICFEWDIVKNEVRRSFSNDTILTATEYSQPWTFEQVVSAIHPDDRAIFRKNVYAALNRPNGEYVSEYRLLEADGSVRWNFERGRVEYDAAGKPLRLTGLSQDISARKQAEEALREADRKKDEFLATLAHELRNPLAPIRNSLELLKHNSGDAVLLDQALVTMDRQVGHMVRLIDDLLDVSRITSNKLALKLERIELTSIMRYAVDACKSICESDHHQLLVEYPQETIWLNADSVRLTQVFVNLLTNSSKYMADHGKIWFTAKWTDGEVIVKVKDTGFGISAEMLPRIFDMFTQVDQSLERSVGGLGIGLSLVKRLVEMHQGSVTAASAGLGFGCEVTVRLPIAEVVPAIERIETKPVKGQKIESRRVLVVDDNRDAGRTLALLLRIAGHTVQNAYDGLEALEKAEEFRPELVLLDIGLPKMNGFEVCQAIRKEAWGNSIVMVALTGWGQAEDRRRSHEAGFNHHLVKPVDHAELTKLLSEMQHV